MANGSKKTSGQTGIDTTADIHRADQAIAKNTSLQFILVFIGLIVFFIVRKKMSYIYSTNPRKKRKHPAYNKNGFFTWIWPVLTTSDIDLININGLDCYVILSLFRMFCWIFLLLVIFIGAPLCFIYTLPNFNTSEIFFSLSMKNNNSWYVKYVTAISVFLVSFIVICVLLNYAKAFISLRQAFIRNPATMHPIDMMTEKSMEQINAPSKTVLLTRIPQYIEYNDDLEDYVSALGLGETKQCFMVQDTRKYNNLLSKRKQIIEEIEKEIYTLYHELKKETTSEISELQPETQTSVQEEGSVSSLEMEELKNEKKMPHVNKIRLLNALLHDKKYDGLQRKIDKFNQNFQDLKIALEVLNKRSTGDKNIIQIIQDEYRLESSEEADALNSDELPRISDSPSTSHYFKSLKRAVYSSPFELSLPKKINAGIVTFKHQRSASVLCQTLISSKLFSAYAQPAPAPTDISYDNINIVPSIIYMRRVIAFLLFIIFTLVFFYLVGSLAVFLEIGFLEKKIPLLAKFLNENPSYRATLNGILTPMTYNILMLTSPIFIRIAVSMENNISKTDDQLSLIQKLSYFLLFNGFLAFIIGTSVYQVSGLKELSSIIEGLEDGLLNSSVFFTNALIQRTLLGQVILLFSLGSVFTKIFSFIFNRDTLRHRRHVYSSEILDLGILYPNFMLIFAICLTYSILTPIILLLGLLFFFLSLVVYKIKFIYNIANKTECGGIHYNLATNYILSILLFFQFINFANLFKESTLLGFCTLVLFVLTWLLKDSLMHSFDRATTYYPLSLQEEHYIDAFTRSLLHSRIKFLKSWVSEDDKDIVYLDEIGFHTIEQALRDHDADNERIYENVIEREGIYLDVDIYIELDRRYSK